MLGVLALLAGQGGQIRGVVIDASGGPLHGGVMKVPASGSYTVLGRASADKKGAFLFPALPDGTYTVRLSRSGFQPRVIERVTVREGGTADLGPVQLAFAGCDAPGVTCDTFDGTPVHNRRTGHLELGLSCAADLDKGATRCGLDAHRDADFRLETDQTGAYLSPAPGAAIAAPDSAGTDCSDARFGAAKVRIDSFGVGDQICVRTNRGRTARVFLENEVVPDSSTIRFWFSVPER